jgi:hypothetical protein
MGRDPGVGVSIVRFFCCSVATLFAEIGLMVQEGEAKGALAVLPYWLAVSREAIS